MSNRFVSIAKEYVKRGYSVIPITSTKQPAIRQWLSYKNNPMSFSEVDIHFENAYGMALLMGGRHSLTCIDFDLKYDLSNDLYERFKSEIPNSLLKKLLVQKTMNGGYHWIFSCPEKCEPNQKLASRFTTEYEKHETYMVNWNNIETRSRALKIATNDSVRVLVETRGDGGYICCYPTPGYSHVYGKINELTVGEYDLLLDVARSFSEIRVVKDDHKLKSYDDWEITPFDDYNDRGDVLNLLISNGWEIKHYGSNSVRLKRAGQTHSKSSALFDLNTKVFNCFSTSTSFDVNKGYNPTGVFMLLECNDDGKECYRKLIELGYGKRK